MWTPDELRVLDPGNRREMAEVSRFLAAFGLSFEEAVEYTVALYRDGRMVATGSLAGEVLRNIAVAEDLQGEGLTATIVSELMREAGSRGRFHYFIYTRPDKARLFASLGFAEIARVEGYVSLLEAGMGSIESYVEDLRRQVAHLPPPAEGSGRRAALVVNCNPFTLGHRAVVEAAARAAGSVVVFVVEEDRSLFPFAHRLKLVREGLADLANVAVVAGGKYIISAATFPAYFTRGEETVIAQTRLDVTLFAERIAPGLGITVRYVGEEPYCPVTAAYNQAMREILPARGIELTVIPRIATAGGEIVSASKVREMIRRDDWDGVRRMVPDSTWRYLVSDAARPIIDKIRVSDSRH